VRRRRAVSAAALALVALTFAACSGGDDEEASPSPAPSEAPSGGATPPSPGALPPGIAECLADQGFDIEPSELHSVPPQVLQECFGALHQGGGAP
jgi:hypothetical protein